MLDLVGADHRLVDSANALVASDRGNLNGKFQTHIVIFGMHARGHVHDHANVKILELRVHEGIHQSGAASASHSNPCLKASGGDWHARADAQLGVLPIHDTNLRIVNDLRGAIG